MKAKDSQVFGSEKKNFTGLLDIVNLCCFIAPW